MDQNRLDDDYWVTFAYYSVDACINVVALAGHRLHYVGEVDSLNNEHEDHDVWNHQKRIP